MANEITEQEEVKCSFCGKPQSQVKKIVAGNGVYICNECIDLSKKIQFYANAELFCCPSV